MSSGKTIESLIVDAKQCTTCSDHLPHVCNPVFSIGERSQILVIGQAPGKRVHETGVPWNDPSGNNLRSWLGVTSQQFYDPNLFGILPMGFCYPGTGESGDLPPRPECAPQWHGLFLELVRPKLTLLIGQYAQHYYLKDKRKRTLTETVRNYRNYLPEFMVLPHPSPRNNRWLKKNPWFIDEVVTELKSRVQDIINDA